MSDAATVPDRAQGLPVRRLAVEVMEGPDAGKRCLAEAETISIGTSADNDLVLTDNTVSRYHLELRAAGDRITLHDYRSTNGTSVLGGQLFLERASARPGTVVSLGRTKIRIDDGGVIDVALHGTDRLGPLVGRAPEMRRLMAQLGRASASDLSVLVLGETGVGKEVVAQAVHETSRRAGAPLETVDCGALAPALIASELFGHEKGAFTGAERRTVGAFERANGGTLFLDEIGELPQSLQTMLLGALERRSFRRVGGSERISVDVRVVSATNRDLRTEVNQGTFRQDVYYRIAALKVTVPPLRERPEDIPVLVEHFLRAAGYSGRVEDIIPASVLDSLASHRWPGNVRELRNFVDTAIAMGEAPILEPASPGEAGSSTFPSVPIDRLLTVPYKDARAKVLNEFEALFLSALLERTGGNVSEAARQSKIHRSYLIDMLKRHGLR